MALAAQRSVSTSEQVLQVIPKTRYELFPKSAINHPYNALQLAPVTPRAHGRAATLGCAQELT